MEHMGLINHNPVSFAFPNPCETNNQCLVLQFFCTSQVQRMARFLQPSCFMTQIIWVICWVVRKYGDGSKPIILLHIHIYTQRHTYHYHILGNHHLFTSTIYGNHLITIYNNHHSSPFTTIYFLVLSGEWMRTGVAGIMIVSQWIIPSNSLCLAQVSTLW